MGSKNCPETPRQKMISLMYMVYTAMLALNVDKTVLDAFYVVDEGLVETIEKFDGKNASMYNEFAMAAQQNPEKTKKYKAYADEIKVEADKLFHYIQEMKVYLVKTADGPEGDIDNIQKKDDTHIAAQEMIHFGKGTELKNAIAAYRERLIKMAEGDTSMISTLNASLDTNNPPKDPVTGAMPTWETEHFQGYPLVAVMTLMTKMQSDVRNAETDMVNFLYSQIDAGSFKFNKLIPQVIPQSTYVLEGGEYKSEIFLAAVDTTEFPTVKVGSQKLKLDQAGKGQYSVKTSKAGKYSYNGTIMYRMPDGQIKPFKFKSEYEVAKPSLTISPTKMNVFYMGVANPVSISVPGLTLNQIHPSITNGRLEKKGNGYVVYPSKEGKSVISVSADLAGKKQRIGSMDFRVKKVPDPIATIADKNGGSVSKGLLLAQQGIIAKIPEFDFDLKFKVTSFVVSTTKGGFTVDKKSSSNKFTADQMNLLKGLSSGSRVYFDNIMAKGEDGTTRKLASISFKIN